MSVSDGTSCKCPVGMRPNSTSNSCERGKSLCVFLVLLCLRQALCVLCNAYTKVYTVGKPLARKFSKTRNVHRCRWYRLLGDYCFSVSSPNQMVKKWVIDKLWWTHLPGSFVHCEPCQVEQMSNLINWEVLDLVYKHEVGTRKSSAKGKLLPFIASDSFCSATILTVFSIWLCTVTRNGTFITVFCFQ